MIDSDGTVIASFGPQGTCMIMGAGSMWTPQRTDNGVQPWRGSCAPSTSYRWRDTHERPSHPITTHRAHSFR